MSEPSPGPSVTSSGADASASSPYNEAAAAREQAPGGIAHEVGALHRLLVESVQDYAIFALDPGGHILSWNAGAQRFKGYTADEIIGRHFSIFYPPEKVAAGWPDHELKEAARVGRFEDEGWRVRKDGTRFWANVVITALHDSDGRLLGFGKVTRDLTERRAGEERALDDARRLASEESARRAADVGRQRSEQLQVLTSRLAALHTVSDLTHAVFTEAFPVMGVDAGSFGIVEAGFVRIFADVGYDALPEALLRMPLDGQFPMSEAIASRSTVVCTSRAARDARFPSSAKALAPFQSSVVVPLMRGGQAIGALAMHRRAGQHEGQPLTSDLIAFMESVAQQCAQALERTQLYESERQARRDAEDARARAEDARARAEEANKAKSEFLAAMSHELRTPLNAIAGYTQLLELGIDGDVSGEQRERLRRIRLSQQHLLGIINDILNFARIDAGQIKYDIGAVPLSEVLSSVSAMIVPQATMKGVTVEPVECPTSVMAWADRGKVEQIVLNLLSNAVKFTSPGGRISVRCQLPDTGAVECRVSDTGTGIAADQLDRIFEPFVQVGRSLTVSHEGTGLGLAISRDLARAMGGDIVVESKLNEGSTFTLTLPRTPHDPADTARAA